MSELIDIVKKGGEPYQALIRKAVEDPQRYAALHEALALLFSEDADESRRLAIGAGIHVGDRHLASLVAETLVDTLQSDQPLPDWTEAGVAFVSELLVPTHSLRQRVFVSCLSRPETRLAGWKMSRQQDAASMIPYVEALLSEHPTEAKAVAIKFALVWQDSCERLAQMVATWSAVDEPTFELFLETMEVYLMRVRRVRLWRTFLAIAKPR